MFFNVCWHLRSFRFALIGGNLTGQSTGSRRGIGGGIQIPETQLQALLPFPTPPPERPGELARRLRNPEREIQNPRLSGLHAAITYYSDLLYPRYQILSMLGFEFRSSLNGGLCKALDVCACGLSRNTPPARPKKPLARRVDWLFLSHISW